MRNIEQYFLDSKIHGYTYYYDLYVYEIVKANFVNDLIEYPVMYVNSSDDVQTLYLDKGQFFVTNTDKNKILFKYDYEL